MREKWYADNRDLVKWSALLTLVERHGAKHILQVLYYRSTKWEKLEVDGERIPIPEPVICHFRNVAAVSEIKAGVPIDVLPDICGKRDKYFQTVIDRIRSRPATPGIVLLDPDTGLEPLKSVGLQHVLNSELTELWAELNAGDVLVLYQHRTRDKAWLQLTKVRFEQALGLSGGNGKIARSPLARDVAFLYAQKE